MCTSNFVTWKSSVEQEIYIYKSTQSVKTVSWFRHVHLAIHYTLDILGPRNRDINAPSLVISTQYSYLSVGIFPIVCYIVFIVRHFAESKFQLKPIPCGGESWVSLCRRRMSCGDNTRCARKWRKQRRSVLFWAILGLRSPVISESDICACWLLWLISF